MNETKRYKLALSFIKSVGPVIAKRLVTYSGTVEAVFFEKESVLQKIPGVGPVIASDIIKSKSEAFLFADKELIFIEKHGLNTAFYLDKDYPAKLQHIQDAPLIIYYKGVLGEDSSKIISVVGTRSATSYGLSFCEKVIEELSIRHPNLIIVSGLAYGVDICAHRAAINNGLRTYAVLAHNLGMIYPQVHESTARKIIKTGALISECTSKHIFDKYGFVRRNRIVAGMADATLVVESGLSGGSLITADLANSYNRDVLALPGRYDDEFSKGCNHLIKTNRAALVESASDIEYVLGWKSEKQKQNLQKALFIDLSEEEEIILEIIKKQGPISLDVISLNVNLPVSKVSPVLLSLEFKNLVKTRPGNYYEKL